MPKAGLNGLNIYYEMHGSGDPLVLIAGYSCRTNHWDAVIQELAHRYMVLIFDNRGAGQSDAPDSPYSIELMAQDTCALLDHLKISSAHILGHSMGGCIAQQIAAHNPRYLKKLILSNSLVKMNTVSALAQAFLLQLREDGFAPEKLAQAILPWIFSSGFLSQPDTISIITDLILKNPYPQTLVGTKRQLEALLAFDSSNWCSKISAPTLVIGGNEDILCPRDSRRLSELIPHARLTDMPGVAHVPMLEKAADFILLISEFLNP